MDNEHKKIPLQKIEQRLFSITILKPSTCSKHEEEIMFLLKAGMQ
jgi:hypothetical protein